MCGIVGYIGDRDAVNILLDGLGRLEYRGYDSAGIALLTPDRQRIQVRRAVGKLVNLRQKVVAAPVEGNVGIGHTRWATHGKPSTSNAHPQSDNGANLALVHNGIVENFLSLKDELLSAGIAFQSETDTEVIVHLLSRSLQDGDDFLTGVRGALQRIEGASAVVFLSRQQPDKIVAARLGNAGAIVIGLGDGENFVASDIPAILEHTRRVVFLENRQLALLSRAEVQYFDIDSGEQFTPTVHTIAWDPVMAAKGEYKHFMQKEIFEQPQSVTDTLRGRIDFITGQVHFEHLAISTEEAKQLQKLTIVACGTSYYAGLVGKFLFESIARLPTEVDYGSEFRYRDPLLSPDSIVLALTQSGETVDTLAAMEEGHSKGTRLWTIVNAVGSQAARVSDGVIYMQAGPEIGVASTKAFTASLVDEYLLALYLGQLRGTISAAAMPQHAQALATLPKLMGKTLATNKALTQELAGVLHKKNDFLYLGRGINYPIALEGALKLKEISYIHAEGYPAGEMKHGPIALIDENMPVVIIAPHDHVYDKMVSQVEQVKARNGSVVVVGHADDQLLQEKGDWLLPVPRAPEFLLPALTVLPLQLLAYEIAARRGTDVDQPRNLAKSVTVE